MLITRQNLWLDKFMLEAKMLMSQSPAPHPLYGRRNRETNRMSASLSKVLAFLFVSACRFSIWTNRKRPKTDLESWLMGGWDGSSKMSYIAAKGTEKTEFIDWWLHTLFGIMPLDAIKYSKQEWSHNRWLVSYDIHCHSSLNRRQVRNRKKRTSYISGRIVRPKLSEEEEREEDEEEEKSWRSNKLKCLSGQVDT